jgi:hypothetical protein
LRNTGLHLLSAHKPNLVTPSNNGNGMSTNHSPLTIHNAYICKWLLNKDFAFHIVHSLRCAVLVELVFPNMQKQI